MKVLFMGSPTFAVPSLKNFVSSQHQLVGVFTQPDRPRGRGGGMQPCPVKEEALRLNLTVVSGLLRDPACRQLICQLDPEVIAVVAFGQLLPAEVLNLPPAGCLNLHASLLPKYRGAAPIHRAIINGDEMSGVTTMFMSERLDAGDVILQQEVAIVPGMTMGDLHDMLAHLGAGLLLETLHLAEKGELPRSPQEENRASYAPAIYHEDEKIEWRRPARDIVNQVLGLNPFPGAYTIDKGQRLKVWRAEVWSCARGAEHRPAEEGTVVELFQDRGLVVQAGMESAVLITEVQPASRRFLSAAEYIRGRRLQVGDKFYF